MSGIVFLVVFGLSIYLMTAEKRKVIPGTVSNEPLTGTQKMYIRLLCIFNPIITGLILYYGWRKALPTKASQANKISFITFFVELLLGIGIVVVFSHLNG